MKIVKRCFENEIKIFLKKRFKHKYFNIASCITHLYLK